MKLEITSTNNVSKGVRIEVTDHGKTIFHKVMTPSEIDSLILMLQMAKNATVF